MNHGKLFRIGFPALLRRIPYWSLHSDGANFAFADGSIHVLRYSAASVMPALATQAGGEPAGNYE